LFFGLTQHSGVDVPHALEAKYPEVGQRWGWFWVFPRRHRALICDRASCAAAGENGAYAPCRSWLGHSDLSTTMIYTHVLKIASGATSSPLDLLAARSARTAPGAQAL